MQYEVWQRKGNFGASRYYRGRDYKEGRIGIFLQIAFGLDSLPNPTSYREQYYIFYISDDGSVNYIPINQGYLKPLNLEK